jgi:hypothetical protein
VADVDKSVIRHDPPKRFVGDNCLITLDFNIIRQLSAECMSNHFDVIELGCQILLAKPLMN